MSHRMQQINSFLHGNDYIKYLDGGSAYHCNLEDYPTKEGFFKLLNVSAYTGCNYFCFNIKVTICNDCKHINKKTDKRSGKKHELFIISITNNLFSRKLEKFINIDKSNNFHLPKIDKSLYPFFLAGVFDGDGSFSIYGTNKNKIKSSLISTKECLEQIIDLLELEIGIEKRPKILKHYTTYRFYLYKHSESFLDYIYNDDYAWLFLTRKYKKYHEYKSKK